MHLIKKLGKKENKAKYEPTGKHFIVDLISKSADILNDVEKIKNILEKATKASGSKILYTKFIKLNPQGVIGAVIIKESHITIHTWPEHKYAAIDIYTCGKTKTEKALKVILKNIPAVEYSVKRLERGPPFEYEKREEVKEL